MNFKSAILAGILAAGLPMAVQAQEAEKYEEYRVGCEAGVTCNDFNVNYQQPETDEEISQRTRPRRTRRTSSRKKIYVGGTLGAFFSGEFDDLLVVAEDGNIEAVDPGTGIGGSLYGGYKFTDSISADGELVVYGGGADPLDDSGYAAVGFFLNPRYTLALNKDNPRSPYGYISPGLGIVGLGFSDEIDDQYETLTGDDDDLGGAGFAIQAKAGVGYPVSDSLSIFGQVRYLNSFNNFEVINDDDTEDVGISSFGLEAGINFNL